MTAFLTSHHAGHFRKTEREGAIPFAEEVGKISERTECKVAVVCPASLVKEAPQAIRDVHP